MPFNSDLLVVFFSGSACPSDTAGTHERAEVA